MANKALICSTFLILLELLDLIDIAASKVPPPVLCGKPHETVVALDPSNHAYYPFYVKLHRCMGSKGALSPKVRRCVPSGFEELNIPVYEPAKNYKRTNLLVKNHTSCTDECVASPEMCNLVLEKWDEESCTCQCMYPDEPPKEHACKERFRWNKHWCRCECDRAPDHCPLRMVWSNEICGCRCQDSAVNSCLEMNMGIDVQCNCVNVQASGTGPEVESKNRMYITLLIGQAAVIIILVCALVHWVRKGIRGNSAHSPLDRSESSGTADEDVSTPYLEVAVESESTESLEDSKLDPDNLSVTVPLSPKERTTDL